VRGITHGTDTVEERSAADFNLYGYMPLFIFSITLAGLFPRTYFGIVYSLIPFVEGKSKQNVLLYLLRSPQVF
jgi:hypothetical protein